MSEVIPRVFSPTEWDAQVDYDLWTDPYVAKDKVIVHYGGNASWSGAPEPAEDRGYEWPSFGVERAVLRMYEQSHLSRKWRGLAYGWAIGATGNVYRIRGWNLYGAHRGDLEPDGIPENNEAIPVLFLIGGPQVPTEAALASFEWLMTDLEAHEAVVLPVFGHQEVSELGEGSATACPGVPLMEYVDARRAGTLPPTGGDMSEFSDPRFEPAFNELVEWGVFSEYTQPQDEVRAEKFAEFLVRARDNGFFATNVDVTELQSEVTALEITVENLLTDLRSV